MRIRATALPVIVLACAITGIASAQSGNLKPKSTADSLPPAATWSPKPTGTYELELGVPADSAVAAALMPAGPMAATVTIKDEADKLSANFWKHGDNDGHEMTVTTSGRDLILEAQTPRGALRITLQQHGSAITGSWSLAGAGAGVTGRRSS